MSLYGGFLGLLLLIMFDLKQVFGAHSIFCQNSGISAVKLRQCFLVGCQTAAA